MNGGSQWTRAQGSPRLLELSATHDVFGKPATNEPEQYWNCTQGAEQDEIVGAKGMGDETGKQGRILLKSGCRANHVYDERNGKRETVNERGGFRVFHLAAFTVIVILSADRPS
jgi:hypothetical protein